MERKAREQQGKMGVMLEKTLLSFWHLLTVPYHMGSLIQKHSTFDEQSAENLEFIGVSDRENIYKYLNILEMQ